MIVKDRNSTGSPSPCPACSESGLTSFFFAKDELRVYRCRGCGVEFLNPPPDDKTLARIYSEDYFIGSESADAVLRASSLKRATASLYLQAIQPFLKTANPKTLEIGCGSGDFLCEAQSKGHTVEGLEFSAHAASVANQRLGSPAVSVGSLDSTAVRPEYYDLLAAFDVIEHVRDPARAIGQIHASLRPGGVVALVTPSLDSWSRRLLGKHWMEYKAEHLTYFSRESLRTLLSRHDFRDITFVPNFKVLSLDYVNGHFQRYPVPAVSTIVGLLRAVTPSRIAQAQVQMVASGTMVLARKRG